MTYALGLLMLGSFGYQATTGSADRDACAAAVAAVVEFLEANPDVEVDPRLSAIAGAESVRRVREEGEARRRANGVLGLRERLRSRTQKKYDALEEAALKSIEALPAWRFGVVGRQSPGSSYLTHAFVHEALPALAVSLVFFLLAGLALESVWGSMLFASLCVVGCAAGAASYVGFYAQTGSIWIGASGLVATLLGAYFIRAFGGFAIPGWLVVPAWAALEYLYVRGIWIENFKSAPLYVHLVCFGVGAGGALIVWLFGIESRLRDRRSDTPDLVVNQVVDCALQAKQEGRLGDAFRLLEQELKRSPGNREAAVVFWDVAVAMGRAEAARPAMLSSVRDALRRGDDSEAVRHWLSLVGLLPGVEVEARFAVHMGEVLLDKGHPDEAVRALCKAVDGSKELSPPLASRVVRASRDLDPDLTRRAAALALGSPRLDPAERAHLQAILDECAENSAVGSDRSDTDQTDARPPPSESQPGAPGAVREPSGRPVPSLDPFQDPYSIPSEALEEVPSGNDGTWEFDDYQDPHSISGEALEDEASEKEAAPLASRAEIEGWNSPGMLEDLSDELSDDEVGADMDLDALDQEHLGHADEDTESHFVVPAQWVGEGGADSGSGADAPSRPGRGLRIDDDTAVELCDQLRGLRVRNAVPLALEDEGIALDVTTSGKTTLPYDRIDALSVAAVERLSQRAVIVVDAILNWISPPGEPLKTIRFRSDEFNPCALAPGAKSAVEALRATLGEILRRSGATPLPDAAAASGRPFTTYSDLGAYERAVLTAAVDGAVNAGRDKDGGE